MTTWLNTPIRMRFRVIGSLSVRFAGSNDRGDHALLLSPWPQSLLAFQQTWESLAEHAHLVTADLPGFGHSQRRDEVLSPRATGEFVAGIACRNEFADQPAALAGAGCDGRSVGR